MTCDRCVRCGKCLAVCPLFLAVRAEHRSPRGRIIIFDEHDNADGEQCFACLRCVDACPFDLSPLKTSHRISPPRCPDRTIPGTHMTLGEFHAIIYDFSDRGERIRRQWEHLNPGNLLVACWLEKRGVPTGVDFPGDCDSMTFDNGELFNPFVAEDVRRDAGGSSDVKVFWNSLLECAE